MGCAEGLRGKLRASLQQPQCSSGDMEMVRWLLQSLDQHQSYPQLGAWMGEGPSHVLFSSLTQKYNSRRLRASRWEEANQHARSPRTVVSLTPDLIFKWQFPPHPSHFPMPLIQRAEGQSSMPNTTTKLLSPTLHLPSKASETGLCLERYGRWPMMHEGAPWLLQLEWEDLAAEPGGGGTSTIWQQASAHPPRLCLELPNSWLVAPVASDPPERTSNGRTCLTWRVWKREP